MIVKEEESVMTLPADVTQSVSRRDFLKLGTLAFGGALLAASPLNAIAATPSNLKPKNPPAKPLPIIEVKSFDHLKGQIDGISWNQLSQHIGLYEGYVKKLNKAHKALNELSHSKQFDAIRDLQLKQSYSLNGAVLHDLYFSNMGGFGSSVGALTKELIIRDFGTMENYLADLKAVGAKMRGWALTGFNTLDGRLHNYGLDAHDVGTPLSVVPVLVMDVYEHAYMIDFGTKRAGYLDAFTNNINWHVVDERLKIALGQVSVQDCVTC